MSLTRRSLLGLAAAAALAGCRPRHPAAPATARADDRALEAAIDAERALLDSYAAAIAASDAVTAGPLTAARDRHEQHLLALVAAVRAAHPTRTHEPVAPTPAPSPADPTAVVATLTTSVAALQAAAVRAHDGPTAGLLASVAAEHAADLAVGAEPS